MNQVPDLVIEVMTTGKYPSGVGEPAVTVAAPAIANAVYNASGARVRSVPIHPGEGGDDGVSRGGSPA